MSAPFEYCQIAESPMQASLEGRFAIPAHHARLRISLGQRQAGADRTAHRLALSSSPHGNEVIFKRLLIESARAYLKPLKPAWAGKIILLEDKARISGAVVGRYSDK